MSQDRLDALDELFELDQNKNSSTDSIGKDDSSAILRTTSASRLQMQRNVNRRFIGTTDVSGEIPPADYDPRIINHSITELIKATTRQHTIDTRSVR